MLKCKNECCENIQKSIISNMTYILLEDNTEILFYSLFHQSESYIRLYFQHDLFHPLALSSALLFCSHDVYLHEMPDLLVHKSYLKIKTALPYAETP